MAAPRKVIGTQLNYKSHQSKMWVVVVEVENRKSSHKAGLILSRWSTRRGLVNPLLPCFSLAACIGLCCREREGDAEDEDKASS